MCQIISNTYQNKAFAISNFIQVEIDEIIKTLNVKGSDEYSFFCYSEEAFSDPIIITSNNEKDFRTSLTFARGLLNNFKDGNKIGMVWFSRQKPEEEAKEINLPPYYNEINKSWYWIHGTISNDQEMLQKYRDREPKKQFDISVDVEIFKHSFDSDFKDFKGLYTYFELDSKFRKNGVLGVDKGMGLWKNNAGRMQCSPFDNSAFQVFPIGHKVDNVSIAFSAGMDITLSTYKILSLLKKTNQDQKVTLNYFRYGSNAEEIEIENCRKATKYFQMEFPELSIEFHVLEVPGLIHGIVQVSGEQPKLLDKAAIGDAKETEENLAYVPYRNTLFCMALNAKLQKDFDRTTKNFIVLGLNLSEGMVFGDNNSAWLEQTEKMLSYGGKFYQDVKIISPYLNRTKTNTLLEFKEEFGYDKLEKILDLSFSCYYPKDGKECNECGSCILRNKAIFNLAK